MHMFRCFVFDCVLTMCIVLLFSMLVVILYVYFIFYQIYNFVLCTNGPPGKPREKSLDLRGEVTAECWSPRSAIVNMLI